MPRPEPLLEIEVRIQRDVECAVWAYSDGFELRLWRDEDGFAPRHWLFRTGAVGAWVRATGENELRDVGVHGCAPARLVPPVAVDDGGDVSARLAWPAAAAAFVHLDGGVAYYEVHLAQEPPARWAPLGTGGATAGIAADGRLVRIACSAPMVEPRRTPVRLTADRHVVSISAARFLHVKPEPSGPGWYEPAPVDRDGENDSARGNATLLTGTDGRLHSLDVHDLGEGDQVDHDTDAPPVDEVKGWVSWPCDVRADAWGQGDARRAAVRFGDAVAARWARLGENVWAGTTGAGQLAALVLAGLDEVSGRPHRLDAHHRAPRCTVYGLVGEPGTPSGWRSGFGGMPTALRLVFGDLEGDRWIVVGSSREPDRRVARRNLMGDLAPGERLRGGEWEPAAITVDGAPVAFELTRHSDHWGALARIGHTTVSVAARGHEVESVALATIADVEPLLAVNQRDPASAAESAVEDLMDALHNHAGAPPAGSLFTDRVVEAWGGRERYGQLLELHTTLRPLSGHGSSGEATTPLPEGGFEHRIHIHHAPLVEEGGGRRHTIVLQSEPAGPRPPDPLPSRAAIGRGERHAITFRLVPDGERLLIDTDLLAILIDRLGSIDEVARPLSQQR